MGKEGFEAGKYYRDKMRRICFITAKHGTGIEVSMRASDAAWGQSLTHNLDGSFANGGAYDLVLEEIDWDKIDVPGHPEARAVRRRTAHIRDAEAALAGALPCAAESASTPQQPIDPSIQRDKDHEPIWLPGHKDFDSFPDLADWGVTSGTQEQPKSASGWWARG